MMAIFATIGGGNTSLPVGRRLDSVITECWERGKGICIGETGRKVGHHRHIREIESTWRTSSEVVIVDGEVAVAIGIGAGGCNVRGIKHIGIHQCNLRSYLICEEVESHT